MSFFPKRSITMRSMTIPGDAPWPIRRYAVLRTAAQDEVLCLFVDKPSTTS
jgi:hypothetical protein